MYEYTPGDRYKGDYFGTRENIVEEEAEQFIRTMLERHKYLPSQEEFDLTSVADRDPVADMHAAGITHFKYFDEDRPRRFETVTELVRDPRNWEKEGAYLTGLELYNFICEAYGFRPNVAEGSMIHRQIRNQLEELPERDLDIGFIDEKLEECMLMPIKFSELNLQEATIEKFKKAKILTVGDYLTKASRAALKHAGISDGPLVKIREWVRINYHIDRQDITKSIALTESVKMRYAALRVMADINSQADIQS